MTIEWVTCPWCNTKIQPRRKKHNRPNGSGSAYKRGNTWTGNVPVGERVSNTGKRYYARKTKSGFKTKKEALAWCDEIVRIYAPIKEQQLQQKIHLQELRNIELELQEKARKEKAGKTIAEYFATYSTGKMLSIGKDKQSAYRTAYKKMETIHNRPVSSLTVSELQSLVNEQCSTYYPAKDMRTLFKHLFRLAAADGYINNATMPDLIELPSLEEEERQPFTNEEQKLLWESYEKGNVYAAIPLIMIYTGMMTGEMRMLTVEMIDLKKKEIVGVGMKTKVRKKNSVLLPDSIIPVIEAVIATVGSGKLYPVSEEVFYSLYYQALQIAGTRKLTPYSCRHTAATALAINQNIAPQTIKRIMRWSTTKMLDRYVHPDDDVFREALNTRKKL